MNYLDARELIVYLANRLANDKDFDEYIRPQVIELLIFLEDLCLPQE